MGRGSRAPDGMHWLEWIGLSPRGQARIAARIVALSGTHAERLAEIHAGAFARPWSADEFSHFLLDRGIRLDGLLVGRDRQPSGFALSRVTVDEAEILSFAMARAVRGRGYGRTLLAHHLETLAHAGAAKVHLEVEEGNAPALAVYTRLGFVRSGMRPGYYARPDGTRVAALSMTRLLRESGSAEPV